MPEYDNNMRGVLFKNNKKQGEKSPDYKGQAEIDGQEYWLSAWVKEGKKGKFLSLAFKAKDEASQVEPENTTADMHDTSIPF
jgi:hypothetical protein